MIPGFHVGALLLHDQVAAIAPIVAMGYRCVALRPRIGNLDPTDTRFGERIIRAADAIGRSGITAVIDTDSLYLHDPLSMRGPCLASADAEQAALASEQVGRWIDIASEIGAPLVTLSSGRADDPIADEAVLERLSARLNELADLASRQNVTLALRPRCGDAIATVAQFERLGQWLGEPDRVGLAADVGEMLLGHEIPVGDRLARNMDALACVYLCDHRSGTTGDQRIGQGDVALSRIVARLATEGYRGPAIIRVDGHSELGYQTATESISIFAGQPGSA